MDEIDAFFDVSRDFVREPLTRSYPVAVDTPKQRNREYNERRPNDAVDEQARLLLEMESSVNKNSPHCSRYTAPSKAENADDEYIVLSKVRRLDGDIYSKYNFNERNAAPLPIDAARQEIVNATRDNFVTILEGDTGCGKTTQVPQYILDDARENNKHCNIVCTQPRRIAAISVAQRVSDERNWPIGSVVGYKVGLHTKMSEDTRILYCTTGVLLQKLILEKNLRSFTHIIVDEVHERDQELDLLLIIIRKFLSTNSQNVKIVLMSATINTNEFAEYFKIRNQPAPVLCVDKTRHYEVSEYYFNDLLCINSKKLEINYDEPGISSEMYTIALKLIMVLYNEQQKCYNSQIYGSILVFLPGINEIDTLCQKILQLKNTIDEETKVMPIRLHSLIPPDEQHKVFVPVPNGYQKVILATNIAESSITVPDVRFVIDFCLAKSLIINTATNFTSLQLHWASRANCRQRAGRAGRVMHGRVYRMVDKHFYERCMSEFSVPEMLRCPLENVILKVKLLDIDSPRQLLALAMSPPNMGDIFNTMIILKEIGALFRLKDGEYNDEDGELTFMGRVMASMPLDIRLTRLIIFGYIFGCLEDAIIIAAGLNVRSIFKCNSGFRGQEIACHIQKLSWADDSGSDLIAILTAYRVWTTCSINGESEYAWAKRHFINLRNIQEMHLLVIELKERLLQFNIKENTSYQQSPYINPEKVLVLKIVIAGAFYPNYFTRSAVNDIDRERSIHHNLYGRNPCNTVYFTNFDNRLVGHLYTRSVKDLLHVLRIPPKNIDVHFQSGSQRIFVTFKTNSQESDGHQSLVPGKVRPELYKAILMRLLGMKSSIRVMEVNMDVQYARERGISEIIEGVSQPLKHRSQHSELVVLPSMLQKHIHGYITHLESCSKFYFQSTAEMERLREIHETLNSVENIRNCKFTHPREIVNGMILSAPFDNRYHRAKVLKNMNSVSDDFKVLFIDHGPTAIIKFDELRFISNDVNALADLPPRSFICRLALILPTLITSPDGKWSNEAIKIMQDIAKNGQVEIEVYSVVEGIANVFLRMSNGTLNEMLVEKGLARYSDECFLSKSDHDKRMRKQSSFSRCAGDDDLRQYEEYLRSLQSEFDEDLAPPPSAICTKIMHINGPFSPLETKIYSAVKVGNWKSVTVERESVNFVVLDTDPQDAYERLIVAANVTETNKGDTLIVRSTTLMPNIHGFGALMTLIFCPTMQTKMNSYRTKYVSILAGLGYDKNTFSPLYEDHDIVLTLDVNILPDDFELVNQLRYCMDRILFTANKYEERPQISHNERAGMMAKVRDLLIKLFSKERKFIETHVDRNDNLWQDLNEADMVNPIINNVQDDRAIFPLHSFPRLYDEKFDRMHSLCEHCEELHKMAQSNYSVPNIKCLLCNQSIDNAATLRIHLLSKLHRDREYNIRYKGKSN